MPPWGFASVFVEFEVPRELLEIHEKKPGGALVYINRGCPSEAWIKTRRRRRRWAFLLAKNVV